MTTLKRIVFGVSFTLGLAFGLIIDKPSAIAQISEERMAYCRAEAGPPAINGEIIEQIAEGGHVIAVDNGNNNDAFLKLKSPDGTTVVAFIVTAHSQVSIETIPDGEFYIYFASGKNFSRAPGCGFFTENLYVEKFPDLEEFYMEEDEKYEYYSVLELTLHSVEDGNVVTEEVSIGDFLE